jgi:spore photoproduct lyase
MIESVNRKSMLIRYSGRSSDYITPSFGYGCLLNCSYCYMKRHLEKGLTVAKNYNDILTAVNNHAFFDTIDKPNQTDDKFITYDFSCNEDFALHLKYHKWEKIFDFFRDHPIAKGTIATKIIPTAFLSYNPNKKVRIRFSLMPQTYSTLLEPNTSLIIDRIKAINTFIEAGYDIHINFSPVVVERDWLKHYEELFKLVNDNVKDEYKKDVKCEVIFLTHNESKHIQNVRDDLKGEELLWVPRLQEDKTSGYGGKNVRYKLELKGIYIREFMRLHNEIIPWNTIRYIF